MSSGVCSNFLPQFYRKFLCANCFHDIAEHFPDAWKKESRPEGDVFVNAKSGQRITAKASLGSSRAGSSRGKWQAFGRARPDAPGTASGAAPASSGAGADLPSLPPGQSSSISAESAAPPGSRSGASAELVAEGDGAISPQSATLPADIEEPSAEAPDELGGVTSGPSVSRESAEAAMTSDGAAAVATAPSDPTSPASVAEKEDGTDGEAAPRVALPPPIDLANLTSDAGPNTPLTPSAAPTTGPTPASPLPERAASSEHAPAGEASAPAPPPRKLTPADLRVRFFNTTCAIFGEQRARGHLRSQNVSASFARPSPMDAGPFGFRVGADAALLWETGRKWAGGTRYGGFVAEGVDGRLANGVESAGGVDGAGCGAAYAQQLLEVCPGLPPQVAQGKRKGQKQVPRLLVLTPHTLLALHPVEPEGGTGAGRGSPKPDKSRGIRAARAVFSGGAGSKSPRRGEEEGSTDDGWGSDDEEEEEEGMLCLVQWERSLVSLFTTELVPPAGLHSVDLDPATGRKPRTDVILRFRQEEWAAPYGGKRCLRAWRRRLAAEHDLDRRLQLATDDEQLPKGGGASAEAGRDMDGGPSQSPSEPVECLIAGQPTPAESEEVGRMVEIAECSQRGWLQKRPSKGGYFSRWLKRYSRLCGPQQHPGDSASGSGAPDDYGASFCVAYANTDVIAPADVVAGPNPDAGVVRKAVQDGKVLFLTPGGVMRIRATCAVPSLRPYMSTRSPSVLIERTISPGDELGAAAERGGGSAGHAPAPSMPPVNPSVIRIITQDMDREFKAEEPVAGGASGGGEARSGMAVWLEALCAVEQAGAERSQVPIRLHFPCEEAATSFHDRLRAAVSTSKDVHTTVAAMAEPAQAEPSSSLPVSGLASPSLGGGRARTASSGAVASQERQWRYIDDFGRQQGPFPETNMRAWTGGGFFHAETLVRCVTPPAGVDLQAGLMPDQTCMFLPLQVLFADPETAFNDTAAWVPAYNRAAQYQLVVKMATELGSDPTQAVEKAMQMQENGLPPELPILLDIVGMREIGGAAAGGQQPSVGDAAGGAAGSGPRGRPPAGSQSNPGSPQPAGASPAGMHGMPHSPMLGAGAPDAASAAAIAAVQAENHGEMDGFALGEPATGAAGSGSGDAELAEALRRSRLESDAGAAGQGVDVVAGAQSVQASGGGIVAQEYSEDPQLQAALAASMSQTQRGGSGSSAGGVGQPQLTGDPTIDAAIRLSLAESGQPS